MQLNWVYQLRALLVIWYIALTIANLTAVLIDKSESDSLEVDQLNETETSEIYNDISNLIEMEESDSNLSYSNDNPEVLDLSTVSFEVIESSNSENYNKIEHIDSSTQSIVNNLDGENKATGVHSDSTVIVGNNLEDNSEVAVDSEVNGSSNVVVNITTLHGNESTGSEDEIPSFSEWTQKVLAEAEKSGTNGNATINIVPKTSTTSKLRQKNYASPDCGAKILGANPEAEHASAVLEPSRDEYLLSICSSKIWFVIELCEAIQAKKVEIANFELFSSSPKDFRVYISDRYPTRDWIVLGQFTATDERSVQGFLLEHQTFGKFVKVEVTSHYGTEHYCPISLFRLYGTSEYEVLDSEESRPIQHEDDSTEEDMLETVKSGNGAEGRNLFGSAKDAVMSIVKKAAEALGKSNAHEFKDTNKTAKTSQTFCHSIVEIMNVTKPVNSSLSCQWSELNFLASLSWLRVPNLKQCQNANRSYFSREIEFAKTIWGISTVNALCHWIHIQLSPFDDRPHTTIPVITVDHSAAEVTNNSDNPLGLAIEVVELDQQSLEHLFSEVADAMAAASEIQPSEISVLDHVSKHDNVTDSKIPVLAANGGSGTQQKESVFVRLSNRIKALERNMSLSSQYLEELSRRYKRQVDDMQKTLNRTLKTLNETLQRMAFQEERYQITLQYLGSEIQGLKSNTQHLSEENRLLRAQIIERHLFLMLMELTLVVVVLLFCFRRFHQRWIPPPSDTFQYIPYNPETNFGLEAGQRVEDISGRRMLTVDEMLNDGDQPSPALSVVDSSSSGCESAFSFPTLARTLNRELGSKSIVKPLKGRNKLKNKRKFDIQEDPNFRKKQSTIRLKSDNWEWYSRAKVSASTFIKKSFEESAMRSSV